MTLEEVKDFARKNGYYTAEAAGKFHGMDAYIPKFRSDEAVTGYPYLILDDRGKLRFSTLEETREYIGAVIPKK